MKYLVLRSKALLKVVSKKKATDYDDFLKEFKSILAFHKIDNSVDSSEM
jgi:hypothetical protein